MRISLEGHTGTAECFERVNCLKMLKKKLSGFFEITVDRVGIRCRIRPLGIKYESAGEYRWFWKESF